MNLMRAGRRKASRSEANSATAERNISEVSKLEHLALKNRTPAEKFSDAVVARAGRLWFVVLHAVFFGLWMLWNAGFSPTMPKFDPAPFPALNTFVAMEAIFLSLFILMSQNRSNRRADERAHLDLQVNLLAEHESTKTLELLLALCAHHGLPQAKDPEIASLLLRTEPANLAREIERQLPGAEIQPDANNPTGNMEKASD